MEFVFNGIVESLEHKSILVTGSTGFLAKIFVEKILRVQPNVKRLYLLLRAPDAKLVVQRLHTDVLGKEVFRVLRNKYGPTNFESFILEKITPIAADISLKHLGIDDCNLRQHIWNEVDAVVNVAANTKFEERYDAALDTNTLGAKNVMDFAKECAKLNMFLHVSTAYVCGEKSGLILEKPFEMGETLNGTSGLDIDEELKLVEETLSELHAHAATKEEEALAMKELGIKSFVSRAKLYGWPNTYVFTKAMGEMLLGKLRKAYNLPLVIVRPTIITGTNRDPFPGWMEGTRTIDSLAVGYGKGRLKCFLGDSESILDMIPGDMVANAMIVAMITRANQASEIIYQVGSSLRNPAKLSLFRDVAFQYFSRNPWTGKDGKLVRVPKAILLDSVASFNRHLAVHYMLPLKGLQLLNAVLCQFLRPTCTDLSRRIDLVQRFVELYKPYIFFKGIFDNTNLEQLERAMKRDEWEAKAFCFDANLIDWEDYFVNIHLPGIVKYIF
ncbi:hypothetical protein Sjap_016605 [Stephania japonica]|uniref:Fatty acyl-CoA reductase n=1 Tax=Stephania japonica TaxID=461633 RepID=A0AAP0ILC5_9MAGN